jgi:hypothetical protein
VSGRKACRRGALPRALLLALAGLTCLAALPRGADAQVRADFRRTSVFVQPSLSLRHFLGPLGDQSSWSLGVGITQGVQFGFLGVQVTLDTDYFLSHQTPPPHNAGFQISGLDVSTRFQYPFGDFRAFALVGYRRVGFISNALVLETGPDLAYHALSTGAGLRFLHLAPFYFELGASWAWLPALEQTSLFGATVSLGIRTVL